MKIMKLKEKFDNVEIMFEGQMGTLKYDELCQATNECVKLADEYAIDFLEWIDNNYYFLSSDNLWYYESDGDVNDGISTKELLEIFKKWL